MMEGMLHILVLHLHRDALQLYEACMRLRTDA